MRRAAFGAAFSAPVFTHAVRAALRTAIIAAIGLGAFTWIIMASSASFSSDAANIPPIIADPPRAIVALLGGAADLLRAPGWLAAGLVHPIVLSLSAVGAFLVPASSGVSELERGTLDLVLARPVSRTAVLGAKMGAMLVILAVVMCGGVLGALVARFTVEGADALSAAAIARAFAGQFLLFTSFGMIAMWIFSGARLRSRALGATIGILIGAFLVNFLSLLFDALELIGYATPFRYFRAASVLADGPWLLGFGVLVATSLACAFGARRTFVRRDLTR